MLRRLTPVIIVAFWGSAIVLTALSMRDIGPMAVAFWRWLLALPPLWGVLLWSGQGKEAARVFRSRPLPFVAIGFTGMTLLYGLQNLALRYTSAFNTSLFIELTPIFITLLAWMWLRERPDRSTWLGIFLGFSGAGMLALGGADSIQLGPASLGGDVLAIGAALAGAIYTVYGKDLLQIATPLVMLTLGASLGVLQLLPLALLEGNFWPTGATWLYLLTLGVGAGAFGNLGWFRILSDTAAARASIYLFATALVASVLAVVILGDPLTFWLVAGGVLVIGGVRLVHRRE